MFNTHCFTTIDLLRHGECVGDNIYRGSTDVALSDTGWAQLRQQAADTAGWQTIVTSPLQRCSRFAAELAQQHALPLETTTAFQEIHFGDWEGRLIDDIWNEQGNHVRKFFADPVNAAPPNGEPMHAFEQRVITGWHSLLSRHRGRHLLLVTHGGTIRIILAAVLGMPLARISNLEVPYACASRIRVWHSQDDGNLTEDFASLLFHNGQFLQHAQ